LEYSISSKKYSLLIKLLFATHHRMHTYLLRGIVNYGGEGGESGGAGEDRGGAEEATRILRSINEGCQR
jgi:hypothetical protein